MIHVHNLSSWGGAVERPEIRTVIRRAAKKAADVEMEKLASTERIEMANIVKEIWEKTIDTQMHFNEMSVKSRQLGLTLAVAALSFSAAILVKDPEHLLIEVPVWSYVVYVHVTGLMIAIVAAGIFAVQWLDLGVYHKMLRGAVHFGEELERAHLLKDVLSTSQGLTQTVSDFSRHKDVGNKHSSQNPDSAPDKGGAVSAYNKLRLFYYIIISTLMTLSILTIILFGRIEKKIQEPLKAPDAVGPESANARTPSETGKKHTQQNFNSIQETHANPAETSSQTIK